MKDSHLVLKLIGSYLNLDGISCKKVEKLNWLGQ